MKYKFAKISIFSLAMLLAACVSSQPRPSVSEYVKTEGGGFAVGNDEGIKYGISYTLLKSIGKKPSIRVEFENPKNGSAPLIYTKKLGASQQRLDITSKNLPCIENNRNYHIKLILYSNGKVVATHKDQVQFSVPTSTLNQLNLKICKN
jgi:hypothetical protein